jgi:hypothetical protein
MAHDLKDLAFTLSDKVGEQPLGPRNVDLPTLRGFLAEVEGLIRGDMTGASLADSRVEIEEGSLKVVAFITAMFFASVKEDMALLAASGDLDLIQPRRAKIIEAWQERARRNTNRKYMLGDALSPAQVVIHASSRFEHKSENAWVAVEKYLTGKVTEIGGKTSPNVHVTLAGSGETVVVDATERQLGAEKENYLYKDVTLRLDAEQHLRTRALRNLRLIEFSPQANEVDEQGLTQLWDKGRKAWADVRSAAGWVEELRGNQ